MSNPYQPPADNAGLHDERRVRQVVMWHRAHIVCLVLRLCLIACITLAFVLNTDQSRAFQLIGTYSVLASFLVTVASGVSIVAVSVMCNRPIGFLWAALNFVPCLGLAALFISALQTRADLRAYGLKVGLLGA